MSPHLRQKFFGTIDAEGNLVISKANIVDYKQHLLSLRNNDVQITIDRAVKNRSENQNRYYFGVVLKMLAHETGHTKDEIHEACKMMFLSFEDDGIKYCRSTSDLSTHEMDEYLEHVKRWAASDLNLYIPDPNEIDY